MTIAPATDQSIERAIIEAFVNSPINDTAEFLRGLLQGQREMAELFFENPIAFEQFAALVLEDAGER